MAEKQGWRWPHPVLTGTGSKRIRDPGGQLAYFPALIPRIPAMNK